jgi:DNA-binding response OmpR family regulator
MNDPPRILVIDDDEMLLVLVRHFLLDEGYELLSLPTGLKESRSTRINAPMSFSLISLSRA